MKKQTKNKFLILLICLLTQACSASNEQKGVVSSEDLTIQTTITTVTTTVQESPEIENLTEEEAQLILAGCLREKGYDVADPKNDEGLRTVLTPIFISFNEKQRQELFDNIQLCAEENSIPLESNNDFENPADVADRLDTELEFAQCLRGKGIDVSDPSSEEPLRPILIDLVQSQKYTADQIREAAAECFDDLGLDPPPGG